MTPFDILRGKTAVITGSGRGIGRAIGLALASHGANVAINYFRQREQAEEAAAQVEALLEHDSEEDVCRFVGALYPLEMTRRIELVGEAVL